MDDNIAIKVAGVSKDFRLPHEKTNSIKNIFTSSIGYIKKRKTYELQHALKDINLEINKGEFFGIVGRNGSGKSTLLKLLAGIYQPTKGNIRKSGRLVPFIELGVGFNPELTGRENIYLNGALLGFSEKEVDRMYDEIVSFAELAEFMDQKLKNYSSGMKVRLAFSTAIRAEAEILLIDEVLAVGDADFQRKCYDYFKNLKKVGTTVVFVTHDMNAVREYCDKALLIEDSRIVTSGSSDHVATEYLRMFAEAEGELTNKAKSKRWGSQTGTITKIEVPKKIKKDSDKINITIEMEFRTNISYPIIGFVIKDATGQNITGFNNKMLFKKTGKYRAGDSLKAYWEITNIFTDGIYTIDVAVLESEGITVVDWWDSAVKFSIFENVPSIYKVSPPVKLNLKLVNGRKHV